MKERYNRNKNIFAASVAPSVPPSPSRAITAIAAATAASLPTATSSMKRTYSFTSAVLNPLLLLHLTLAISLLITIVLKKSFHSQIILASFSCSISIFFVVILVTRRYSLTRQGIAVVAKLNYTVQQHKKTINSKQQEIEVLSQQVDTLIKMIQCINLMTTASTSSSSSSFSVPPEQDYSLQIARHANRATFRALLEAALHHDVQVAADSLQISDRRDSMRRKKRDGNKSLDIIPYTRDTISSNTTLLLPAKARSTFSTMRL